MKIAVLGGGNGSHAAAADLTLEGHQVQWWRRDTKAVAALQGNANALILKDSSGSREVTISAVTDKIDEALSGAQLIVCPLPANAQPDIARLMAPHLVDGQVIYLPPGSFGSFMMAKIVRGLGNLSRVAYAEAGTLPYLARKHAEFEIAVTTRATRLPTGVFPQQLSEHALRVIKTAFASVEDAGNALSGALMNAGPIIHPPLIIMNAGPIEHFDHWDIHNEGTQPAIRRVTDQLDAERIAVREALGFGESHFPLSNHYDDDAEEWMYGNLAHEKLTDSGDWREHLVLTEHRYMREDVAVGLSLLVSIADWSGIAAPVATGLLALGSSICGEDFYKQGRTLDKLGLGDMTIDSLSVLLQEGFDAGGV